ncbi:MAG: LamG domain-containing protein, partial [Lentisphaeraceae bacterium]|nr:LamG domain-containing protein [Lentisphaeraceae bacterium]
MIKNTFIAILVSIFGTTFLNAEKIAHWYLNDSLSASSAIDSTNGHNANKVGAVVFEKDGALTSTGTAATFDGSSTLEAPYTTTLNPNGSFSVDAWVKPTGGSGTRSFVSSRSIEKNGFIVRIESNNKFRFYLGDGEWRYVEGPTAVLNEWTHVLATFESQSVTDGIHTGIAKLFINGQLFQFKTLTYKANTSSVRPLRIGGGGDKDQGVATVYNFIGDIDEVKIANHILQPVDLVGYFDNTSGLTREIYYGIESHGVHLITSNAKYPWYPDVIDTISDFDYPSHLGDNYGVRIRGFITIPADGDYTFYL